jgi:hypothetical protein
VVEQVLIMLEAAEEEVLEHLTVQLLEVILLEVLQDVFQLYLFQYKVILYLLAVEEMVFQVEEQVKVVILYFHQ